jgi:hypothetical protein
MVKMDKAIQIYPKPVAFLHFFRFSASKCLTQRSTQPPKYGHSGYLKLAAKWRA